MIMTAMSLIMGCAGQPPHTKTGAALGGGVGALTGKSMGRSWHPQYGFYIRPYYGYCDDQPYDHRYGHNDGFQSPPSNNNYGRPYPPPGYRSYPPYVAQNPESIY